jgi:hypothetical protein
MRHFFFTALLLLAVNFSYGIERHTLNLQFATDAFTLSAKAQQQLDALLDQLPQDFEYQIEIKGHTDAVGSNGYNARLAGHRAEAVKKYLLSQGVSETYIELSSFGESRLLTRANTAEARQKNRRVELNLVVYKFDNVEELEQTLSAQAKTELVLNSQEANSIVGKQGTQVYLPPNSFTGANGQPYQGQVKITLQEALTTDQFLSNHLATQSSDELLVSGGMFKISAFTLDGAPLTLDSNTALTIAIPAPNGNPDPTMQQFTSTSGADWELNNNGVNNYLDFDMPPIPVLNFKAADLPKYKGYNKPKPVEPEVWTEPRMPSKPDYASFEPDLSLVEMPMAAQLKRKAKERYEEALEKHEADVNLYWRKKELYDVYAVDYADACKRYQRDLKRWRTNRAEDSISFITSDKRKLLQRSNDAAYDLATKKYWEKRVVWDSIYAAKADSAVAVIEDQGFISENMMNFYVSRVTQLKWINIDRFLKIPMNERMLITLQDADNEPERAFIVFKTIQSVLPLGQKEIDGKSTYYRNDIPKKERCALLAYRVENGKPMVYYEDYRPQNKHRITYKSMSFTEFKDLLKQLNA